MKDPTYSADGSQEINRKTNNCKELFVDLPKIETSLQQMDLNPKEFQ